MSRTDAHDALAIARREQPDLISLDISLPDASGLVLLDWLKQGDSTRHIPVLLLSIMPDAAQAQLRGAADYLTKPVSEMQLVEHVRAIVGAGALRPVLLVDTDTDADARARLGGCLREAGYKVSEAAGGAGDIVALVKREQPAMVLLGVRVPDGRGLDVLRAVRADPATREIPVVTLVAGGNQHALQRTRSAIEALGSAAVERPHSAEEVAEALARGLAGR